MTREAIMQRQQELVAAAGKENRDLTPAEQSEFDTLQRELDRIYQYEAGGAQEQHPEANGQRGQNETYL